MHESAAYGRAEDSLDSLQCRDVPSKPRLSKSVALSYPPGIWTLGSWTTFAAGRRFALVLRAHFARLNSIQYLSSIRTALLLFQFALSLGARPFVYLSILVILPPSSLLGANR